MSVVRRRRRGDATHTHRRGGVVVEMDSREALDLGRWLETEPHGDPSLGTELVKYAHEAWEREG